MTKLAHSAAVVLLLSSLLAGAVSSSSSSSVDDFDLFFFVQQWPGSLCDSKKGCCFPDTGKPAPEFSIHGLWPMYAACRPAAGVGKYTAFNILGSTAAGKKNKCWPEPGGMRRRWSGAGRRCRARRATPAWISGATSGRSTAPARPSTSAATSRGRWSSRAAHDLTAILADAGIVPSDSDAYFLSGVRDTARGATGFDAIVECNRNKAGEAQLYQVYLCVARDGGGLVDCPAPLLRNCADKIKFPAF